MYALTIPSSSSPRIPPQIDSTMVCSRKGLLFRNSAVLQTSEILTAPNKSYTCQCPHAWLRVIVKKIFPLRTFPATTTPLAMSKKCSLRMGMKTRQKKAERKSPKTIPYICCVLLHMSGSLLAFFHICHATASLSSFSGPTLTEMKFYSN